MKNLLLTICYLLGFSALSHGQTTFAPVGAKWIYEGWMDQADRPGDCEISSCPGNFIQLECVEKRMVLDSLCSVIEISRGTDQSSMQTSAIELFLYGNNGREYFVYEDQFYLMRDFNLEIGDTLYHFAPPRFYDLDSRPVLSENHDSIIVDTSVVIMKETTIIDGQELISMTVNDANPSEGFGYGIYADFFLEKIGNASAFFGTGEILIADGCGTGLWCYADSSLLYTLRIEDCERCQVRKRSTATKNAVLEAEVSIFPNPIHDILTIENNSTLEFETYEIYTIQGVRMIDGIFSNRLDLSPMPTGVFVLVLYTYGGESYTSRVVKF